MQERWLTVDGICTYPSASNGTIYKWIDARGMPGHNVGPCRMLKSDEVDAWVCSGRAADTASENPHDGCR